MSPTTLLCNEVLIRVNKACAAHPHASFKSIGKKVGINEKTLGAWYRNFKNKKWPLDHDNTADREALAEGITKAFVDNFRSVGLKMRILKRLLHTKCLKDKRCFSRQHGVLESLLGTYSNLNFWLHADFGGKVDDLLYLRGKNEALLRKKYSDFNRNIKEVDLQFIKEASPVEARTPPPPPSTIWDFYEND
tara:strand:+ start:3344 stop:3916 length:573 start_codon:yes stop_codon:yes gene_type:complete